MKYNSFHGHPQSDLPSNAAYLHLPEPPVHQMIQPCDLLLPEGGTSGTLLLMINYRNDSHHTEGEFMRKSLGQ